MDGLMRPSNTTSNGGGNTKVINSYFPDVINSSPGREYHHHHHHPATMLEHLYDPLVSSNQLEQQNHHQQQPTNYDLIPNVQTHHHPHHQVHPSQQQHHHYHHQQTFIPNNENIPFYDRTHTIAARLQQLNLDQQQQPTTSTSPSPSSISSNNIQQQQQKLTNSNNYTNELFNSCKSPLNRLDINNIGPGSGPGSVVGGGHGIINSSTTINDNQTNSTSFFVSDSIREELLLRRYTNNNNNNIISNSNINGNGNISKNPGNLLIPENENIPIKVDIYIELIQIEPIYGANSYTFNGMISTVYRATNSENGQFYCLRRFHSFQPNTTNTKLLMGTIESWKKIQHSNIISLRQVFTTKAFGDNSVIFVYDYHQFSETIMSCYFSNQLNSTQPPTTSTLPPTTESLPIMNGYSTSSRPYSQQQQQVSQPQSTQTQQNTRKFLPEQTIWNYIIQISSAIRTIHQNNLAIRSLDPTKILITKGWNQNSNSNSSSTNSSNNFGRDSRIRLSFIGVFDILTLDTFHSTSTSSSSSTISSSSNNSNRVYIQHLQQEDLLQFGRLCLTLATNSLQIFNNLQQSQSNSNLQEYLDLLPRNYSQDLRNLITYFVTSSSTCSKSSQQQQKPKSIDDIMPMIGARFYMQLDYFYLRYDYLYDELTKEIDNGRLLRLLSKLGTINERPEHQLDPNWSETGDRYMLKLFRDYLFHQFDENGKPWLDLGHIISNLNKFDLGSPEKICLISRDAQNVIIVSFEELKRCFESAINDLMQ